MAKYKYELLKQFVDDIFWNEERNIYWNKEDLAKALATKPERINGNINSLRDINLDQMELYVFKDNGRVSKEDRRYIRQYKRTFNTQMNGESHSITVNTKYHLDYKHHTGLGVSNISNLFPDVVYVDNTSRIETEKLLTRIRLRLHDYEEISYSQWAYVFVKSPNDYVTITISPVGIMNNEQ